MSILLQSRQARKGEAVNGGLMRLESVMSILRFIFMNYG